ncbi:MAG: hypothetical protein CW691_10890 [Candidatus Bathyarchaeum sp.]|nr:MAG: hypothetical protein CW691_10890 [Candidatus Bathyarchaeum sp.]
MNKRILAIVILAIVVSVSVFLFSFTWNTNPKNTSNPENNVLEIKEAYWSGETGRFYFDVHNPTDRFIEDVYLHLEISGFEEIYSTQNIDYNYFRCYDSASFIPKGNVTFGSGFKSCYFDEIKVIGNVGTEYVIEKTVNIEQRDETFEEIRVDVVSLKLVDSNNTLKTILSINNMGTTNTQITEVYKNNKLCENYTINYPDYDALADNGKIPVNRHGYVCIYETNWANYEIGEEIRIRYEVVTASGISKEGSVPRRIS